MMRTGTYTLHEMLWRWEIVDKRDDGLVVASWLPAQERDGDRPFYTLAALRNGVPADFLCMHEHTGAAGAAWCEHAVAEVRRRAAVAWAARCAVLPAPSQHGYLRHCEVSWPARWGGACGTCGAPRGARVDGRGRRHAGAPRAAAGATVKHDIELAIASIDRAHRVGDEERVLDLQYEIAALWAFVMGLLRDVIDDCAAMAAGGM